MELNKRKADQSSVRRAFCRPFSPLTDPTRDATLWKEELKLKEGGRCLETQATPGPGFLSLVPSFL